MTLIQKKAQTFSLDIYIANQTEYCWKFRPTGSFIRERNRSNTAEK